MPRLWPAVCHQDHPEHPPIEGARCRPSKPPMSPMWPRGRGSHVTHEKTPQSRRHRLPTLCQHFQQKVHSQQAHWTGELEDVIKEKDHFMLKKNTIQIFINFRPRCIWTSRSTSRPLVPSAIRYSARKATLTVTSRSSTRALKTSAIHAPIVARCSPQGSYADQLWGLLWIILKIFFTNLDNFFLAEQAWSHT